MTERQGAGAYLGGTGTYFPREGNTEEGIHLPFVILPNSGSALNKFGLNNRGDVSNCSQADFISRTINIPVGWSVTEPPEIESEEEKLKYLIKGMELYEQANVDFLEINESCKNTEAEIPKDEDLVRRLFYVKNHFLESRERRIPVIVKFSVDTNPLQVKPLMDLLFKLGFDGVNFGNASTDYAGVGKIIHASERKVFDYYTKQFGGSISGIPLREKSLELASRAVEYLNQGRPPQEFHVFRTGGVETAQDVKESLEAGISLCQCFTGYFEGFIKHGNDV